jgi:2-polyprenyl-3-methyl-5-hydroxy-6-metoxy-1,4-benzoquinol methylase
MRQRAFRESDIRPEELMREQSGRFQRDVDRLLTHRDHYVEVVCPACGDAERIAAFTKMGFSYQHCSSCRTMYISPRPLPEHLADYYRHSENYRFWAEHIFPASEDVRRERIFRPRVRRLLEICDRHGVATDFLLEVGGGFGTFCAEVTATGRFERVVAVEPTPELAIECRARGVDVVEERVEDLGEEYRDIDVIASFETIEHLFDPSAFVVACARRLRPGGLLVLSCPNGRGFEILTLGAASDSVDPEHLNYFNPSSLSELLERSSFEVVEVSTPGSLDAEMVHKKAVAGDIDLRSAPFLQQLLVDEWDENGAGFQTYLAENRLSSHLWIAARRL